MSLNRSTTASWRRDCIDPAIWGWANTEALASRALTAASLGVQRLYCVLGSKLFGDAHWALSDFHSVLGSSFVSFFSFKTIHLVHPNHFQGSIGDICRLRWGRVPCHMGVAGVPLFSETSIGLLEHLLADDAFHSHLLRRRKEAAEVFN